MHACGPDEICGGEWRGVYERGPPPAPDECGETDDEGHGHADASRHQRQQAERDAQRVATVETVMVGEDDVHGRLVHHRGHDWAFHYNGMGDEEEEPIFRFDRHRFVVGEYVAITEHDGVQRTFRVAEVLPAP